MEDKELEQYLKANAKDVGIEEVRKRLAKIKESLSEDINKERHKE